MKRILDVFIGTLLGLLVAIIVFLTARAPAGQPIELLPTVSPQPIVVYVLGAVQRPGVYSLAPDSRVVDAIQAAGGFSENATVSEVNVARRLEDGQRLEIPGTGELPTPAFVIGSGGLFLTPTPFEGELVNVNTADLTLLQTLPGIGPTTAQRIIDYREENGQFQIVDDLLKVAGIGPVTLDRLRPLVTVGDTSEP
ncbi:MAG: ComEA family DNA-binding protein [Anaerolineales bacterium]